MKAFKFLPYLLLLLTVGCATGQAYTYDDRKYSTSISTDEGVVTLLDTFRSEDKSIASEEGDKSIENCVGKGMLNINPGLRIVSAKDFRDAVFPGKTFLGGPRSSEELLGSLRDPNTQNQSVKLGVRYVIIVSVTSSETEARPDFKSEGGGSGVGCFFGRTWTKDYDMNAEILDVKYLRESGSVTARSTGTRRYGCVTGCAGCLPVPPIPFGYTERTEAKACSALGEAIMKFIIRGQEFQPFGFKYGDVVSQEMPEGNLVAAVEAESLTFEVEQRPSEHFGVAL